MGPSSCKHFKIGINTPLSARRNVAPNMSQAGSAVFKSLFVSVSVTHYCVTNTPEFRNFE